MKDLYYWEGIAPILEAHDVPSDDDNDNHNHNHNRAIAPSVHDNIGGGVRGAGGRGVGEGVGAGRNRNMHRIGTPVAVSNKGGGVVIGGDRNRRDDTDLNMNDNQSSNDVHHNRHIPISNIHSIPTIDENIPNRNINNNTVVGRNKRGFFATRGGPRKKRQKL